MATSNVEVTCEGASGDAAPFVVWVSANGQTVTQESVTGQPVPRTGGEWWSWSIDWQLEGSQVVTVRDATHDGAQTWDVVTVALDCPVPTTTTEVSTTTATPTTTTVVSEVSSTTPELTTTTTEVALTLPVPVSVVEPPTSVSPVSSVDTSTTDVATTVELSTVAPSTTNFQHMDGFYVLSETATSTSEPMLPATGPEHVPEMMGVASLMIALGMLSLAVRQWRRS